MREQKKQQMKLPKRETSRQQREKMSQERRVNKANFSHGGPIKAHHISRLSKLKNGSSREIQMVITFHTDVRFRRIIY